MLQNGSLLLLPGSDRYAVAASIAGSPEFTARGEFDQTETGSVLSARTVTEHLTVISHLDAIITHFLQDDALGLEAVDAEIVAAVAFFGVELHQLLLTTTALSLDIDGEVYAYSWHTLIKLNRQLVHLRKIHKLGHKPDSPYLPEYFAFIAANPIPGDEGSS